MWSNFDTKSKITKFSFKNSKYTSDQISQSRMTTKVHPNASFKSTHIDSNASFNTSLKDSSVECTSTSCKDGCIALTVWRKSLLLNCKGFTVFDGKGNIVFRVDNYVNANRGEILLMDGHGNPVLTIRRKKLSWGDNWQIYEGESTTNPKYLVTKQANLLVGNTTKTTSLAQVQAIKPKTKKNRDEEESILYHIEGSYAQRNVAIYNNKKQSVAQIKVKEAKNGVALGGDVFKLVILRPNDVDCALAMAFVILLDQMFGSS